MEERRSARVGTVSGLALLVGGTAVAAAFNGSHLPFAAALLGVLTIALGHALIVEIRRQAHRVAPGGWAFSDTVNAVLLGGWAELTLSATIMVHGSTKVWGFGLVLALAYAAACGYFVNARRRAIAAQHHAAAQNRAAAAPTTGPAADPGAAPTTIPAADPSAAPAADPSAAPAAGPSGSSAGPSVVPTAVPAERAPSPATSPADIARPSATHQR